MPAFAGVDLAWTAHRESGFCLLCCDEAGRPLHLALETAVVTPDGLAGRIAALGPDVIAAIDAPLRIGPGRTAERLLGSRFGRYRASAHAANRTLLEATGRMAGPHLALALEAQGFSLDPAAITPRGPGRVALEVYPHAFHVVAFNLPERLKYKRKRGRNAAFIRDELRNYQRLLAPALDAAIPGLRDHDEVRRAIDASSVDARGAALKRLEDTLDALTCLLAAHAAWRDGLPPTDLLGDWQTGAVAIPGLSRDPRFAHALPDTPIEGYAAGGCGLPGGP